MNMRQHITWLAVVVGCGFIAFRFGQVSHDNPQRRDDAPVREGAAPPTIVSRAKIQSQCEALWRFAKPDTKLQFVEHADRVSEEWDDDWARVRLRIATADILRHTYEDWNGCRGELEKALVMLHRVKQQGSYGNPGRSA